MLTKSEKIHMNIKDIAKEIRQKLKDKYPKCTFSVTIERYSMGQSMTIALMKAPFEAFLGGKDKSGYTRETQYSQVNHHAISEKSYVSEMLTRQAQECLVKAIKISNEYNFDESDSMTDYFHVNFYLNTAIGKYNKEFQCTKKMPEAVSVTYEKKEDINDQFADRIAQKINTKLYNCSRELIDWLESSFRPDELPKELISEMKEAVSNSSI